MRLRIRVCRSFVSFEGLPPLSFFFFLSPKEHRAMVARHKRDVKFNFHAGAGGKKEKKKKKEKTKKDGERRVEAASSSFCLALGKLSVESLELFFLLLLDYSIWRGTDLEFRIAFVLGLVPSG